MNVGAEPVPGGARKVGWLAWRDSAYLEEKRSGTKAELPEIAAAGCAVLCRHKSCVLKVGEEECRGLRDIMRLLCKACNLFHHPQLTVDFCSRLPYSC